METLQTYGEEWTEWSVEWLTQWLNDRMTDQQRQAHRYMYHGFKSTSDFFMRCSGLPCSTFLVMETESKFTEIGHWKLQSIQKCSWHSLNVLMHHSSEDSSTDFAVYIFPESFQNRYYSIKPRTLLARIFIKIHNTFARLLFMYTLGVKIQECKMVYAAKCIIKYK